MSITALKPSKYFQHPQYEYSTTMVNKDITTAIGVVFPPYGAYDTALGRSLIETKLGKKIFTPLAALDPQVARYQIDKNLP
jgi:hypothetical protein